MITNEQYIQEYVTARGLGEKRHKALKVMLNHYSKYQQLPLHELLTEADTEEEQGIRWKHRRLKTRLINYMNYCKTEMKYSSAKEYFNTIKSFYNHHEIELGTLPRLNPKNANISPPITAEDLPTNEIIRKAVNISNPLMTALLVFISSSGMSKVDTLSLTVNDFLEATYPIHHTWDIEKALNTMVQYKGDIVPCFKLRRSKTNKYFITFCTDEATKCICDYLRIRNERNKKYKRPLLSLDDKLFKISNNYYQDKFVELNKALGLGRKGSFNQLRGHMLRKFHASKLEKGGMSRYFVNVLQGKGNNSVDDVYFFADEDLLRREYMGAMHELLIFSNVSVVGVESDEYKGLLLENELLRKELLEVESIKRDYNNIMVRIKELEDVLDGEFSGDELSVLDKFF